MLLYFFFVQKYFYNEIKANYNSYQPETSILKYAETIETK